MANIPLIRFEPPARRLVSAEHAQASGNIKDEIPMQPGTLSLTPAGAVGLPVAVAIILALLGAIQPFVNSWVTSRLQTAQEEARLRSERTNAEAVWIRSALAVEDDTKREAALKFLLTAGLVHDSTGRLEGLTGAQIPFLRPPEPAAGQAITNSPPPPAGGGSPGRGPGAPNPK